MGLFRWPRPPWSITGFCEMWQPGKARPGAVGYRNITTRGPHARVSARDASASPFRYYRCGLAQNPSSPPMTFGRGHGALRSKEDVVVVEATGNAASVAAVIAPQVKKVVIANPKQVRVIAHAKIKTDTIDASVLAQLYASGFLPEVWLPDEPTQALRRQVTRRNQIVRQRSRLKNSSSRSCTAI